MPDNNLPKLPEPVAYIAAIKAQRLGQKIPMMTTLTVHRAFSDDVMLFTAEQMAAYAQEATRQAMERTLSICRQMEERGYDAKDCAEAIEDALRALIPQSEERHG